MSDEDFEQNPPRYEHFQLSEVVDNDSHRRVLENKLQTRVDCLMIEYRGSIRSILGNPADTTYFYDLIRRCADTASFCLMEEYLITQNGLPAGSMRYNHITDARRRIGEQLIGIVESFDRQGNVRLFISSSFKRQVLKMRIVNQAIEVIQMATLGAGKELFIDLFPLMALAHSLLATANHAGEYICRCLDQDKKPASQELWTLISSPPHGPEYHQALGEQLGTSAAATSAEHST